MNSVQVAFTFALGRAARLRVVSADHFPSLRVNKVHLRTDRAIHRHKLARVRSLVFLRDETLHPVPGGGALEQKSWHMGAIINLVPETSTPDKHVSFGSVAVAALSPAMGYGQLRGRLAPDAFERLRRRRSISDRSRQWPW